MLLLLNGRCPNTFRTENFVKSVYDTFKSVFAGQTSNFTKYWNVKIRQGDDALIVKLSFVKPYTIIKPVEAKPVEDKNKKVVTKKETPKKITKKVTK